MSAARTTWALTAVSAAHGAAGGRDCHEECDCVTGEECHHVTGECAPCSQGRYCDMSGEQCECDDAITELCSHKVTSRLLR